MRWARVLLLVLAAIGTSPDLLGQFRPSGRLEVHYINVGQGGATLIIGPDGTRILYDFGNEGRGTAIVNYLRETVGLEPRDGIHVMIVSHRDQDHYGGYVDVTTAGYDVLVANFDSGSPKVPTAKMKRLWLQPAAQTRAGLVRPIPVGLSIPLGDGAEAKVIAANGKVYLTDPDDLPLARNENDRSVALYVKYGGFDYLLDGDLGAGPEQCTNHQTGQRNFQTRVAEALVRLGWMDGAQGVDVLHIAHHGSESSTSSAYFNLTKPEIGLISVGLNQGTFRHPREDVVTNVLLGPERPDCVVASPLVALFQTENGLAGTSSTGMTSFRGLPIGDIRLTTDGRTGYEISGNGRVGDNVPCANPSAGTWRFALDERDEASPRQINARCTVTTTSCRCE